MGVQVVTMRIFLFEIVFFSVIQPYTPTRMKLPCLVWISVHWGCMVITRIWIQKNVCWGVLLDGLLITLHGLVCSSARSTLHTMLIYGYRSVWISAGLRLVNMLMMGIEHVWSSAQQMNLQIILQEDVCRIVWKFHQLMNSWTIQKEFVWFNVQLDGLLIIVPENVWLIVQTLLTILLTGRVELV